MELLSRSQTLLALVAALALAGPGAAQPLEYAVKAAYLSKFGAYVEWPASAFTGREGSLNLCVVGDDPFGAILDQAAGGQRVAGRPLAVQRLPRPTREAGCHILYIPRPEGSHAEQIIKALQGAGVLTVTDDRPPGAAAGIINFVIRDDRVRFEIDAHAAAENGLSISSKLLNLAVNVKPRR